MAIDMKSIEPAAAASTASGEALALFSIAISMKRLADAVTGDEHHTGIHEAIVGLTNLNIPR